MKKPLSSSKTKLFDSESKCMNVGEEVEETGDEGKILLFTASVILSNIKKK